MGEGNGLWLMQFERGAQGTCKRLHLMRTERDILAMNAANLTKCGYVGTYDGTSGKQRLRHGKSEAF